MAPIDFAASGYGAEECGLICAYLFEPDAQAQPIESVQAATWLAALHAAEMPTSESFVWLHFNLAHASAERWLARHAGLSDTFFETLKEGLYSTRIERAEQSLIAVINDVHFDFAFEPSDISTLWINVDQRVVVTARHQPLRAIDQLRTVVKRGEVLRSTAALLEHLMRAQADVLVEIVRGVTRRVDQTEDELLTGKLEHRRARLGEMRRLLVRLQRLLAPSLRRCFGCCSTRPTGWRRRTCRSCANRPKSSRWC